MQAYARALSTVAQKSSVAVSDKALLTSSKIEWMGSSASVVQGEVTKLANVLGRLWTAAYELGTVKGAIRDANPHIQKIDSGFQTSIVNQRAAIDGALLKARKTRQELADLAAKSDDLVKQSTFRSTAILLGTVIRDLDSRSRQLEALANAVKAFADAHQALYMHLDDLDAADLIAQIKSAIADLSGKSNGSLPEAGASG